MMLLELTPLGVILSLHVRGSLAVAYEIAAGGESLAYFASIQSLHELEPLQSPFYIVE